MTQLQYEKYQGYLAFEKELDKLGKSVTDMPQQIGCKEQSYLLDLTKPLKAELLEVLSKYADKAAKGKELL